MTIGHECNPSGAWYPVGRGRGRGRGRHGGANDASVPAGRLTARDIDLATARRRCEDRQTTAGRAADGEAGAARRPASITHPAPSRPAGWDANHRRLKSTATGETRSSRERERERERHSRRP